MLSLELVPVDCVPLLPVPTIACAFIITLTSGVAVVIYRSFPRALWVTISSILRSPKDSVNVCSLNKCIVLV